MKCENNICRSSVACEAFGHCRQENFPMVEIQRDGKTVATVRENMVMVWFHQNHSYSMGHALKYEGYSIKRQ